MYLTLKAILQYHLLGGSSIEVSKTFGHLFAFRRHTWSEKALAAGQQAPLVAFCL